MDDHNTETTAAVAAYIFDLGSYSRPLTTGVSSASTSSVAAQTWFNRGLVWMYGYNHDEALLCFAKAIEETAADGHGRGGGGCAMAHWGIAYGIGPNYNKPWELFEPDEKIETLKKAHKAIEDGLEALNDGDSSNGIERELLLALKQKYPTDPETSDLAPYQDAFVNAMRPIYLANPKDLDVVCIFAEALMTRTPWTLWDVTKGVPAEGASTAEAQEVLERAFAAENKAAWKHPGLLHMYLHLMEMSPTPHLALPHGDALVPLVPDSGHLVHMATHIDVLCGDYHTTITRNLQAYHYADVKFQSLRGKKNFYLVYQIHNLHFVSYGAMFLGQQRVAIEAAQRLQADLPPDVVAYMPDMFEAFWGIKTHVMVRFGMWQELLEANPLPQDRELFCFTTALVYYGRVVALANLGRHNEARQAFEDFAQAQEAVAETRCMFNNTAKDVLKIAQEMALGEMNYKAGEIDKGLEHLRQATTLSEGLVYDEPWGWMQPPCHALAALLMEQGKFEQAESLYRADLGLTNDLARPWRHPNNVWALHGLNECLTHRGDTVETPHIKTQLDLVLARADVKVTASCYCRRSSSCCG